MSTYRVKTGENVALETLTVMDPQPRAAGIQYAQWSYAADGSVYRYGAFVELVFAYIASPTAYTTLLTAFGIHSNLDATVTVYVRDDQFAWVRMNGVAVRPVVGRDATWEAGYLANVRILVRDLAVVA